MDATAGEAAMLFMVIERFEAGDPVPVYRRFKERGRQLPEGLTYVGSWIEAGWQRCFQLMECDDARLLQQWTLAWRGTGMGLEIVPVVASDQAQAVIAPFLEAG